MLSKHIFIKSFASYLLFFISLILLAQSSLNSQTSQAVADALKYFDQKQEDWQLQEADLDDIRLTDAYRSEHNGVQHLYFVQQYDGIDIFNAIATVAVDETGKVVYATQNFIPDIQDKIQSSSSSISATQAVTAAIQERGYELPLLTRSHSTAEGSTVKFEDSDAFNEAPRAQKVYFQDNDGRLRLHWDVSFFMKGGTDFWSIRVDAKDGSVSQVDSWTEHCTFPVHTEHNCRETVNRPFIPSTEANPNSGVSGTYNAFSVPTESPLHGDRQMVEGPANEEASPYGWHDIDGVEGAEYTTLRGNNVNAMVDRNGDFIRDTFYNADGGQELLFDFPFNDELEPIENAAADATNLFYMNNYMHDFAWAYGFDEAAGNFQTTNYSGEGAGNDNVIALTQFQANSGNNLNNASFSTPSDGNGNGVMRMLLWNQGAGGAEYLQITAPPEVSGFYEAEPANFGGQIPEMPLQAEMVFVEDGTQPTTDACEAIENGNELDGKIALIDRGRCEFGTKILHAEQEGAIAAIVINNQPNGLVTMGAGQDGGDVTIPAIFITLADGQTIREFAGLLEGSIQEPDPEGVSLLSSGFDNGIIAHEYAHGISNRLTGGPSQAGCLSNDEQMGEGWSDFFTLATSVKAGDTGEMPRGVGNYVIRKDTDGRGIRAYPYSTDMDINPVTYYSIFDASVPHGLGQVWASMIWDLHWALVDRYGFDPDLINGDGGNNLAIQLVMDGMKLQSCEPGFIDGRDAILAADRINNDGANQCLIWEVFARRGLGHGAEQGSPSLIQDAKESYEIKPSCVKELKISKSVTPSIEPGDIIEVQLEITNHKTSAVTEVVASDLIPDGCTYVTGSASMDPDINGNVLNFNIGSMDTMDQVVITYELESSEDQSSDEHFFDNFEESVLDDWYPGTVSGSSNNFRVSGNDPYSGSQSWFVPNTEDGNDVFFSNIFPIEVSGDKPILRFFHKYDTESGFDGGIVEYSYDAEVWHDLGEDIFRNDYRGRIAYTTFALVNQSAFWGNSGDWEPTYIDLSPFKGESIYIRFRFGEVESGSGTGWYIDDLGIYDMYNYQTEACVSSAEGDNACDEADGRGTFVEYQEGTNTYDPKRENRWTVYPNPAENKVHIELNGQSVKHATLRLRDIRGNVLYENYYSSMRPGANYHIPLNAHASGLYIVEWETADHWYSKKIIKH